MKWSTFFQATVLGLAAIASAASYTNPLRPVDGADPFIVYVDGYYYYTTTTWEDLQITRARTLEGLKTGERKTVWSTAASIAAYNTWAPEIHKIGGLWYMYFSTSNTFVAGTADQGTHVLKGGASPWDAYTYVGKISPNGVWSIDATVITIGRKNYDVFSCIVSSANSTSTQHLCIAELLTATTLGPYSIISAPTLAWEQQGVPVNEGPEALYSGRRTFLTYSASFCWTDGYKLGLLEYTGKNPLSIDSWTKYPDPVFQTGNSNYGPGHNCNFKSPDCKETWNVYHATNISTGACDGNRYTMAQKINFDHTGFPDFGVPVPIGRKYRGPSGEPAR